MANRPRIPNGRTTTQTEKEIFHDISQKPVYVADKSGLKIYIDTKGLEGNMELTPSYDRFEPKVPLWFSHNLSRLVNRMEQENKSSDLLRFQPKKSVQLPGQPLFVLGELYRTQEKLYIGMASLSKNPSFVSCKSENHVLPDFRKQCMTGFVIGGIVVLGSSCSLYGYFPFCRSKQCQSGPPASQAARFHDVSSVFFRSTQYSTY